MTLSSLNNNQSYCRLLYKLNKAAGNFILMDIGARGGIDEYWNALAGQLKVIGFDDSDESTCRFNNNPEIEYNFYRKFIGNKNGMATFNVARYPFSSGLLRDCSQSSE
jgi:hypothetical protein